MGQNIDEIEINGVKYTKKGCEGRLAEVDGLPYVIIRADRAGVFAGHLEEDCGSIVTLKYARRIWHWEGAASLSQLAMEGTSKPETCKFPIPVKKIKILGVIEQIGCTEKVKKSIEGVEIWKA